MDTHYNICSKDKIMLKQIFGIFCFCFSSRDAKLDGDTETCRAQRFQSAVAEAYTRFVLSDIHPTRYLLHRKASFRVTHLVKNQMRSADLTVAQLRNGNIVDGLKAGRTEIQVRCFY